MDETVLQAIEQAASDLELKDVRSSETLEMVATYFVLQDLGLDSGEAARVQETVGTGGTNDGALDAIALLVGNQVVLPEDGIESVRNILGQSEEQSNTERIIISLVFIQTTGADPTRDNTPKITHKISGFKDGIEKILANNTRGLNDRIVEWGVFISELLIFAKEHNILCQVVARLVWPRPICLNEQHKGTIDILKGNIATKAEQGFPLSLKFEIVDEASFNTLVHSLWMRNEGSFQSLDIHRVAGGIEPACFMGTLLARDYLPLIAKPSADGLRWIPYRKLFYDNVRDFLGRDGGVNQSIGQTLETEIGQQQFHLRNNGVTIVTRELEQKDNQFFLSNFQIVNGCQTSYMLANMLVPSNKTALNTTTVPIRIMVSNEQDIIDQAIIGLNRQAKVDDLQILSRRQYVIDLVRMFIIHSRNGSEKNKVFFARRTNEFSNITQPEKQQRVVTLHELMFVYSSAFLKDPHLNISKTDLFSNAKANIIFGERQSKNYYYLSALIILRAREVLNASWIGASLGSNYGGRNQIYYAIRLLCERKAKVKSPPNGNRKQQETYLNAMIYILEDLKQGQFLAKLALGHVTTGMKSSIKDQSGKVIKGNPFQKARNPAFSRYIKQRCLNDRKIK